MAEFEAKVKEILEEMSDPEVSSAIAAIKTLLKLISTGEASTFAEQAEMLKNAVTVMKSTNDSVTSIDSGCELFMRFISNIQDERRDEGFEQCKKLMLERGHKFVKKVESSRRKIAKLGSPHIKENATILVHSRSRVVLELLRHAAKTKKFTVFVTESKPDCLGQTMVADLREHKIEARCILDAAVGYIMEKIDLVFVGAEGVVGSGGIINKVGTFSIAMAAKAFSKPVYVAAESFKFSNFYPLNQQEVPNKYMYDSSHICEDGVKEDTEHHPITDYTPAEYLTLLFTDIGILTPTAVSDELIKLQ